ncbi:putative gustatory receptor 10b [Drosophila biarmipes]|uniref:putative gustatory receptor 10b n=1 Tax=Drosophila biarmipes TaxID=125945 RepID=UPI0021CCC968|nr:putative gustatory receptor 10b [Drosophila biarmipes]
MSDSNIRVQMVALLVQTLMRVLREREVCQAYNEVSEILDQELDHQEPSRFYCKAFLLKIHNLVHNFNFALSVLLIWDMRTFEASDIFANLYFIYNSLARDSVQAVYILLLLGLSEALRLNGQRKQASYGQLMEQLRRQERLLAIGRRVHRMFAWLVASTLFFQLYFNTGTIYLGYAIIVQRKDSLGMRTYCIKILLAAISFLVILGDALLLQIVCEHLVAEENRVCASPRLQRRDVEGKAAHRQWEMSLLRRAIRRASPENKVLGMFRMDMRCAFALISCSLSYGIIIIQMGYVPGISTASTL